MWPFSRLRVNCFCAFCKAKRRIYSRKHVSLTNVLSAAAFSAVVTYTVFGELDPFALAVFSVALLGAEVFVYVRWRLSIVCSLCGFDPILYKKSPPRAAARVNEFFKEQVENPEFWLTRSPLLKHQKLIRRIERKELERQIITNRAKAGSSSLPPAKTL